MKYKGIIFDFDGVIIASEALHWLAFNEVFEEHFAFRLSDEIFENYVGFSDIELLEQVLATKKIDFNKEKIVTLMSAKIKAYQEIIQESESLNGIPGVAKFIETCADQGIKMTICSNAAFEEVWATLEKLGMDQYFHADNIVTIDRVGHDRGKPSPDGYLLARKELGLSAKECVVFEDSRTGMKAAMLAGIDVIAITAAHMYYDSPKADDLPGTPIFTANHYQIIQNWLELSIAAEPSDDSSISLSCH